MNPRNMSLPAMLALLAFGGVGLLFVKFLLAHVFALLLLVGIGAATVWKLQTMAADRRELKAQEQAERATIERNEQRAEQVAETVTRTRDALPPSTAVANPYVQRHTHVREV